MDRFVKASLTIAQRGRRQHTQRTRQHGAFVGEYVAEQIFGEDHVEVARVADQLHCCRINQHVLDADRRKFLADHALAHIAPQA